jgi:hypothetical protein
MIICEVGPILSQTILLPSPNTSNTLKIILLDNINEIEKTVLKINIYIWFLFMFSN